MINTIKICLDCNKKLSKEKSKRCKSCSNKKKWKRGIFKRKWNHKKESIGKIRVARRNEGNGMWKGNKAGLSAIHIWVRARKQKPELCEKCRINPPVDLANISQEYKRDINDFEWLCRGCHMKKDNRILNLKQFQI